MSFSLFFQSARGKKVDAILSRVGSPEVKSPQRLSIPYSVGRSQYQVHDTIKTLLARADEVLYTEKKTRHHNSRLLEPSKRSTSGNGKQANAFPPLVGKAAAIAEAHGEG